MLIVARGLGLFDVLYKFVRLNSESSNLCFVLNLKPEVEQRINHRLQADGVKNRLQVVNNEINAVRRYVFVLCLFFLHCVTLKRCATIIQVIQLRKTMIWCFYVLNMGSEFDRRLSGVASRFRDEVLACRNQRNQCVEKACCRSLFGFSLLRALKRRALHIRAAAQLQSLFRRHEEPLVGGEKRNQ